MAGGGVIFYGTKDTLICGCYGVNPYLVSGRVPNAPKVLREIKESHQMDWVRACKEDADDRVPSARTSAKPARSMKWWLWACWQSACRT